MLKRDKNALLKAIEDAKLNVDDFRFEHQGTFEVPSAPRLFDLYKISFLSTPLYFSISVPTDSYHSFKHSYVTMSPGFAYSPEFKSENFGDLLDSFESWLEHHVKLYLEEKETPDLWSEISSLVGGIAATEDETERFSEDEQGQLLGHIETFRLLIIEKSNANTEQLAKINDRLNYLSEAIGRVNRTDWRNIAIAVLINLAIDTQLGRGIFSIARQAFGKLLPLIGM